MENSTQLKGMIFDLDGTLVDSRLDFDLMREEIGIPNRQPVLEFVDALPEGAFKTQCWEILLRHELKGAHEATLIPGVIELLEKISGMGLHQGILTRNKSEPTQIMLERLCLKGFSQILTREDAPPKPDPTGIFQICKSWNCDPKEVVFVGDYRFDLEAGKRAGSKTILYAANGRPSYAEEADHVADCFLAFVQDFEGVMIRKLGFSNFNSDLNKVLRETEASPNTQTIERD